MYYRNKIGSLQKIFGTQDVELREDGVRVAGRVFPIDRDVIDLTGLGRAPRFAEDIQYTFGAEWKTYSQILPELRQEFEQYFDLLDLDSLKNARVCDLGCGNGRWSYFLKDACKELVLVDFSEAIYVARENLRAAENCLFFKGDITQLPFANDFADWIVCLGVLHHLPMPCLDAVRQLKRLAPRLLIFLYYALDNRPFYFRALLALVTAIRRVLSTLRSPTFRKAFSVFGTIFIYMPLVLLGWLLRPLGLARFIPLYEFYGNKSFQRIQQDVYDRFFTRIEQRVARAQILELRSDFPDVRISEQIPYWHFVCVRRP